MSRKKELRGMDLRDRIEDIAEHNALFLAEEVVLLCEALETIESYIPEDGSVIAHRALRRFRSTVVSP